MSTPPRDALYGNTDMARVMYGENARHVPAWMYVQNQGQGVVAFTGASTTPYPTSAHPLRYGSDRVHQFVVGEIIVRPHLVIATDALRGRGLGGLATSDHHLGEMLAQGEVIVGSEATLRRVHEQMRGRPRG